VVLKPQNDLNPQPLVGDFFISKVFSIFVE